MKSQPRCQAAIYKRDTYRRTGRGKHGFELHYTKEQCSRRATCGDFCYQHAPDTPRCSFAEPFIVSRAQSDRGGAGSGPHTQSPPETDQTKRLQEEQ